jgi:hypothetical protein
MSAVFHRNSRTLDIAVNNCRLSQLDEVIATNVAVHAAEDFDCLGVNIGFDPTVLANRQILFLVGN